MPCILSSFLSIIFSFTTHSSSKIKLQKVIYWASNSNHYFFLFQTFYCWSFLAIFNSLLFLNHTFQFNFDCLKLKLLLSCSVFGTSNLNTYQVYRFFLIVRSNFLEICWSFIFGCGMSSSEEIYICLSPLGEVWSTESTYVLLLLRVETKTQLPPLASCFTPVWWGGVMVSFKHLHSAFMNYNNKQIGLF